MSVSVSGCVCVCVSVSVLRKVSISRNVCVTLAFNMGVMGVLIKKKKYIVGLLEIKSVRFTIYYCCCQILSFVLPSTFQKLRILLSPDGPGAGLYLTNNEKFL